MGDLRDLNHLLLNKEVFNVAKKPEIGSLMIFEIANKNEIQSKDFLANKIQEDKEKTDSISIYKFF